MANTAAQKPGSIGESKSSKKKKARAEAAAADTKSTSSLIPADPPREDSSHGDADELKENPHIKELLKQYRNTNKKLSGMNKIDAVVAENPGLSSDELVKQKKLNADQKAALLKKPQLQAQLAQLEEQIAQFRKFDADAQAQLLKQKEQLTTQHQEELEKAKAEAATVGPEQLRKKLLVLSQFLRCAAAKRTEDDTEADINRAFEGALLLVYGGDEHAVETAINIIEGVDQMVPDINGILVSLKCSCAPSFHSQLSESNVC